MSMTREDSADESEDRPVMTEKTLGAEGGIDVSDTMKISEEDRKLLKAFHAMKVNPKFGRQDDDDIAIFLKRYRERQLQTESFRKTTPQRNVKKESPS
ncbi:hypothetical protein DPMN_090745 [Dreissena polymorpha]|uniref:Uncharacterized protein n=1 Tax=Dreissena polymorpha TaxID=45954 RepID=A0A9D4QYL3_DREPO|nr:hypothetical protein DPMN_090745 [Dreissena polymorpha]